MENASPNDVVTHLEQNPDAVINLKELEYNVKDLENEPPTQASRRVWI